MILTVAYGCSESAKQNSQETQATEKYSGPIIDMHIHAYADRNPLMGMTHLSTLRGKTYEGVASGSELKEKKTRKIS